MNLNTILYIQRLCTFDAMLFIVNLLIKTDSTAICVVGMLEHACSELFSLENCRFGRCLMLVEFLNFRPNILHLD